MVRIDGLTRIIDELDRAGYDVRVPTVRDGVLSTRSHRAGDQLPVGWYSEQAPGSYRLSPTRTRSRFGWAVGPQTWKPLVHPPSVATMTMAPTPDHSTVVVSLAPSPPAPLALVGLRPCDLAALDRLDHVLGDGESGEATYATRRRDAFLVVVNCGVPASTCFCASADTGPHVDGRTTSHDLEVTELVPTSSTDDPEYVVAAISRRGDEILGLVASTSPAEEVVAEHEVRCRDQRERAVSQMERRLPDDVAAELSNAHLSRSWDDVAEVCVACGNCTAVCPTCFCTSTVDVGDLTGSVVERRRDWESCFSLEFSRLGDSVVRASIRARYRQWMTHKLATWHDQFGESGCVGCGRCTTWCPVGIDFVEVARSVASGSNLEQA